MLIWRDSEAYGGVSRFVGLELAAGGVFLPAPASSRRIEFVGDSITCGYGDLATTTSCPDLHVMQSHYIAYPGLVARHLGADQITICQSGIGIYRDYGGNLSGQMPELYPRTLQSDPAAWSFSAWVPHAVLINLGTNDFAKGTPDEATFKNAYRGFLQTIRGHYPNAYLLPAVGPMLGSPEHDKLRDWLTALITERQNAGDAKVAMIEFGIQDGSLGLGCDWHPSAATHAQMAGNLEAQLKQLLGW